MPLVHQQRPALQRPASVDASPRSIEASLSATPRVASQVHQRPKSARLSVCTKMPTHAGPLSALTARATLLQSRLETTPRSMPRSMLRSMPPFPAERSAPPLHRRNISPRQGVVHRPPPSHWRLGPGNASARISPALFAVGNHATHSEVHVTGSPRFGMRCPLDDGALGAAAESRFTTSARDAPSLSPSDPLLSPHREKRRHSSDDTERGGMHSPVQAPSSPMARSHSSPVRLSSPLRYALETQHGQQPEHHHHHHHHHHHQSRQHHHDIGQQVGLQPEQLRHGSQQLASPPVPLTSATALPASARASSAHGAFLAHPAPPQATPRLASEEDSTRLSCAADPPPAVEHANERGSEPCDARANKRGEREHDENTTTGENATKGENATSERDAGSTTRTAARDSAGGLIGRRPSPRGEEVQRAARDEKQRAEMEARRRKHADAISAFESRHRELSISAKRATLPSHLLSPTSYLLPPTSYLLPPRHRELSISAKRAALPS